MTDVSVAPPTTMPPTPEEVLWHQRPFYIGVMLLLCLPAGIIALFLYPGWSRGRKLALLAVIALCTIYSVAEYATRGPQPTTRTTISSHR